MFYKRFILSMLLALPLMGWAQESVNATYEVAEEDTSTLIVVPSPTLDPIVPYEEGWDVGGWNLHAGLNAQFSMNVTAGFGSHAPKGVGFGQSVALAYVYPVNDKLMIVAGLNANHMKWGGYNTTQVGLRGMVLYNPNERINLWGYFEKNFTTNKRGPQPGYPWYYRQPSERFAAGGEFLVGKNASIGVNVEVVRYDNDRRNVFDARRSLLNTSRGIDW